MTRSFHLFIPVALVASLAIAACGSDESSGGSSPGADSTATTATAPDDAVTTVAESPIASSSSVVEPSTAESAPSADSGAATSYPLTVTVCDREWTYDKVPAQVVVTDTPMLDLMLALGLSDRIVGYFGDVDNLDTSLQADAEGLKRLGDNFPYPTLESVVADDPDLVLSYGYNPDSGFTAERLQSDGINNFTVTEGCDDFTGASTIATYYDDVRTVGRIFDVSAEAEALIEGWDARVSAIQADAVTGTPLRVLNTGSGDPAAPFTNGNRAVAEDMIDVAGGVNLFSDVDETYLSPSWEEIVEREPEVLIESSGQRQQGLDDVVEYLESNPALATISDSVGGRTGWISYEEGVPGPQMFNGIDKIAAAIRSAP